MLRQHLFGRTGVSIFLSSAPIRPSSIGKIRLTTILSRSNYLQIQTVFRIIHFCESIYKTLRYKKENCIQSPGVSWLRVVICMLVTKTRCSLDIWHFVIGVQRYSSYDRFSRKDTNSNYGILAALGLAAAGLLTLLEQGLRARANLSSSFSTIIIPIRRKRM